MQSQNSDVKSTFKECVLHNMWFKVLSLTSILLLIASFVLPPLGVIDNSVLAASGELIGWGALGAVLVAIDKGKTISMQHGATTITIDGKKYILEEEKEPNIGDDE